MFHYLCRLLSTCLSGIMIIVMAASCGNRRPAVAPDRLEIFEQNIAMDMDAGDVEDTFGDPVVKSGEDVSVYKYTLADSTQVWIGLQENVVYACLVDKDMNLVRDLVEIPQ